MTTKISEANIQAATLETIGGGPKITSITITDFEYVATENTTVPGAGGFIKITGTGFVSGTQVLFDETPATAVSFINSQTLHAQTPELAAGGYFVYVINPDGATGLRTLGLLVA